jgi:hypothetical protein
MFAGTDGGGGGGGDPPDIFSIFWLNQQPEVYIYATAIED